jgi:hypothetical protein
VFGLRVEWNVYFQEIMYTFLVIMRTPSLCNFQPWYNPSHKPPLATYTPY